MIKDFFIPFIGWVLGVAILWYEHGVVTAAGVMFIASSSAWLIVRPVFGIWQTHLKIMKAKEDELQRDHHGSD